MAKISFTKLGLSKKTDEVKIITYNDQEIEIKQQEVQFLKSPINKTNMIIFCVIENIGQSQARY